MTVIELPSGRRISVGDYVKAWKKLREAELLGKLDQTVNHWRWYPVSGREVLADIRSAMHRRITKQIPLR